MEKDNEIPCSSKNIVFVVVLCEKVEMCDLKNIFEEKFGKVSKIKLLWNMYERSKTGVHITFESPEHADLAIQQKMIEMHNKIPVYIYPTLDEHQDIDFNSPIPCSAEHIHFLPSQLSAEQNHIQTDTSLLQTSSLVCTKDHCSNENDSFLESPNNLGSEDECKITILNDYCLRHIFSFLDKKELIKIERVCKWWQSVSLSCWSSFKEITMKEFVPKNCSMTMEMLRCVLKRCGKYVKKLDIIIDVNNYKTVDYIAEYCSSLRELYINHADICPVSCRALSNAVKQLEILHISECHELNDESLGTLLTKCQNLKDLSVTDVDDFSGKCLSSLNPNTMEKLMICKQFIVKMDELVTALKMMKNLKCLEMDGCLSIRSSEVFSSFIESVPNLEHFVYKNNDFYFNINNCNKTFGNLVNLTYLNVDDNQLITDRVLLEIISNCVNIKKLVLSGCGVPAGTEQDTVTDFSVRKLVNLRQLQDLSLSYLEYVTDHSLEALALAGRLIKLEIRGNTKITDDGCGKIVSLCKDLEHFDMSGCTNITDSTVKSAEAAVQSRTTDKTLHLIVGGTWVLNINKWGKVSPLLIVDPSDLSNRPAADEFPYVTYRDMTNCFGDYNDDTTNCWGPPRCGRFF